MIVKEIKYGFMDVRVIEINEDTDYTFKELHELHEQSIRVVIIHLEDDQSVPKWVYKIKEFYEKHYAGDVGIVVSLIRNNQICGITNFGKNNFYTLTKVL